MLPTTKTGISSGMMPWKRIFLLDPTILSGSSFWYSPANTITYTDRKMASRMPGMTPPRNMPGTETPVTIRAYMITGMLGGMMGPITEEAAVIAAEKSRG